MMHLYFIIGVLADTRVCYVSPAKILLTGIGADEQLGGYGRHRTRYASGGWSALIKELQMDLDRISLRNLGRDDRCMSDHGREARFPWLDENVVQFLSALPIWLKINPCLEKGVGDKYLLRVLARFLGLEKTSLLPKRAIQFGSRIAQMDHPKQKGHHILPTM
jgi:asparagine synthetase B (glutamine-hydrolysing)